MSDPRESAGKLVDDLEALTDLCNEARSAPGIEEKLLQLRAIADVVAKLEQERVPVPEDVRRLEVQLTADVSEAEEADAALEYLRGAVLAMATKLGLKLLRGAHTNRGCRSSPGERDSVSRETLRQWIAEGLEAVRGSASTHVVREWIEEHHHDELTPYDLSSNTRGERRWWAKLYQARLDMVKNGEMRGDTAPGFWELI